MGAGAVAAAAAAGHIRRVHQVLDAFRVAGATAPERARRLNDLVTGLDSEVDELARAGVLVHTSRDNGWYLDEAAYIAWRDRGSNRRARVVIAVAAALAALLVGLAVTLSR